MTITRQFELATDPEFRILAGFSLSIRAGRVTSVLGSGQVTVQMDDQDGGDATAWPLNGFTYAVNDVVYVLFANNSFDSGVIVGSKAPHPPAISLDEIDTTTIKALTSSGITFEDDNGNATLFISDAGDVGIGTTSPPHKLSVQKDGAAGFISGIAYGGFDSGFAFYAPRGTQASPSANSAGDPLGSIYFGGWDTALSNSARIYAVAAANFGTAGDSSDSPGELHFATTPDGSGTLVDRMVITSDGVVLFGGTNTPAGHQLSLQGEAVNVVASVISYGAAVSPILFLLGPRGTAATPTANQSGDVLGILQFGGWDTDYSRSATIRSEATANFATAGDTTDSPGNLIFATVPDGSGTLADRLWIGSDGFVGIGAAGSVPLHVTGDVSGEVARFAADGASDSPFISLYQTTTRRSFIQHVDTDDVLTLASEYGGISFKAASTAGSDTDTEYMSIAAGGAVTITGLLTVGSLVISAGYVKDVGRGVVASQFDKTTNTTLANVTGLDAIPVYGGYRYAFKACLYITADATGGHKYAVTLGSGTITYQIMSWRNDTSALVITSRQTVSGGSAGADGGTTIYTEITGTIDLGAFGDTTFNIQFAQNASNGTSSVLTGSFVTVWKLT